MIGNDDGSKSNVLVQWMSRDYMIRNNIKDVATGPDEYYLLLKKGKIEELDTEGQIHAKPNILRRFADRVWKKEDVQLMIIDTRKHDISIPFEAYSRDRDLIRGKSSLFVSISKDNPELALRLLKENGDFGEAYTEDGFRQFCLEDLTELLRKDTQFIIDTEAISGYDSNVIHEKRTQICTDVISALNSKTPYWANYGLKVGYSSVVIDENEFERLEREERENKLKARQRDLEFAEASGNSEHAIRMRDVINREKAALAMNEYLSDTNLQASKEAHMAELEHRSKMRDLGYEEEEAFKAMEARNRLQMTAIYHEQELARIKDDRDLSDAEKTVKITEIESRLKDIRRQDDMKDFDHEMSKERARLDLKFQGDDHEQGIKDRELERELRRKIAEAEVLMKLSKSEDDRLMKEKELEGLKAQLEHEEKMAGISANVEISKYQNDGALKEAEGEARAAREALGAFKEANATAHQQNLDNAAMTERMILASRGVAPSTEPQYVRCPHCDAQVKPNSKFCHRCGSKIRGDDE